MRSPKLVFVVAFAVLLLTPGCALINSLVEYPTPTPRAQRALRPTFTPTAAKPAEAVAVAEQAPVVETPTPPADQTVQPSPQSEPPTPAPPTLEPPTPTPVPIAIVPGQPVRAHAGPGVTYDLAIELPAGSQLAIVGKNDAGDWWQVCCVNELPVWVQGDLVDEQGSLDAIAVAANIPPAPTPTPSPLPKPAIVVNTPRVNARSGPGIDFAVIDQVLQGTRLEIVGRTPASDWWQVCCVNGQPAWVAAELVATEGPVEAIAVAADLPTPTPQATATPAAVAAGATPQLPSVAGTLPFSITEQTAFPFDEDFLRVGVRVGDAGDQPVAGYALRVLDESSGRQWLSRQSTGDWQYTASSPAFDDFREANVLFDTRGKSALAGSAFRLWLVDGQGRQVSPAIRFTGNGDELQWLYVVMTRQ